MKKTLNFLPKEQLSYIKRLFIKIILQRALILLTCISVVFSAVLFGSQLLLKQETESVKKQREAIVVKIDGDNDSTVENAIQQLNQTTSRLELIQKNHIVWNSVFDKLARIIPQGVTLTAVSFDASALSVTLNGKAKTRDDYSLFESKLRESEYIENVDFPISFLKTDIPFGITLMFTESFFYEK